jgi:hypothetical protein
MFCYRKEYPHPGIVEVTCSFSHWGRRMIWAQEFKTGLGNIVRPCLKKQTINQEVTNKWINEQTNILEREERSGFFEACWLPRSPKATSLLTKESENEVGSGRSFGSECRDSTWSQVLQEEPKSSTLVAPLTIGYYQGDHQHKQMLTTMNGNQQKQHTRFGCYWTPVCNIEKLGMNLRSVSKRRLPRRTRKIFEMIKWIYVSKRRDQRV